MSEEKETTSESLAEVKREVTITPEDCSAAFDFWKHFNVTPIPGLAEAFEAFSKNPTIDNQDQVKYYICKAISTTDHEAFKDPLFEKIVAECSDVLFGMQFDKDLENTLTTEE